jgi:OOP family OmpA-OmpF porin
MKTPLAVATVFAVMLQSGLSAGTAFAADPPGQPAVQPVVVRAVAYFDVDQARLRPRDEAAILAEVGQMKGVTWQTVTATGHTDSTGPVAHNEVLSAERARAVKAYLVGKGLDPAMIDTEAKAATVPLAANDSRSGRAKNRRTEVEFQGVRAASQ